MKVKEEQNFKLKKSGTLNRKKHEQVNTQFVNSTITGCNAQNPRSMGLVLSR